MPPPPRCSRWQCFQHRSRLVSSPGGDSSARRHSPPSANNYSLPPSQPLWRRTYNESSEDKPNNWSGVSRLRVFFHASSVTGCVPSDCSKKNPPEKTQIRCEIIFMGGRIASNSVTSPRWINCCCSKCPRLTRGSQLRFQRHGAAITGAIFMKWSSGSLLQETLH